MLSSLEVAFVVFNVVLVGSLLVLLGYAVRSYSCTSRAAMVHLATGLTLVIAAAVTTVLGGVLTDYQSALRLLAVHNGLTASGFVFIVYSVVSFE